MRAGGFESVNPEQAMSRFLTRRGFSLIEVLIVIGIIGILIALLLPVLNAARRSARATACLANLHQWGEAYHAYLSGNGGKSFVLGTFPSRLDKGNNPLMWWEILQPYEAETKQSLLCPEATEAANMVPRNAFEAWGPERFWDTPTKIRGPYVGSYGFNGWLYREEANTPKEAIRLPTTESTRVPVIIDSADDDLYPEDTDPPLIYKWPNKGGGMRWAVMKRHKDGVNALFLDGHAEQVSVPGLWKLKWSETFQPKDVKVEE